MKYYLCITPFFPDKDHFQGPYILDQVKAIERMSDYKVVVLKPSGWYMREEDYEYDGIKVLRFDDYSLPSNLWPNRLCDCLTARSLIRKLRKSGIDIKDVAFAHAHVTRQGAYANALKRLNPDIKTVVQHHGFDVMSITDGRLARFKFHERQCIRHGVRICNEADLNIGVSRKTLDYVLAQPGIHLKQQYVLYNGVDTSLFYPKEVHRERSVFTIGCVGNFWPLKDQMTLIKAVELLVQDGVTNLKCIFIGSGETLEECIDYVASHNLSEVCEFRKEMPHEQLPDFYRSLDLFVLPSYWEAFGCVYTEAYACGVPFIGVRGQGIEEMFSADELEKWFIEKGDFIRLSSLIRNQYKRQATQNLDRSIDITLLVQEYISYIDNEFRKNI